MMATLTLNEVIAAVRGELVDATFKHGALHSAHEGYGVLMEEVHELMDAMRANDPVQVRAEALQVAAMGARIVLDCT